MVKNKISNLAFMWLALTFTVIIPFNSGNIYGGFEVPNILGTETVKNEKRQSVCSGGFLSDPKDSFVQSALTMCLPGMLEKTYEWREFQCEKVVCKYDAISYGIDPTFCEKQYSYRTCSYFIGEGFAMPGLNLIESIREKVATILANPVGLLWSQATSLARGRVYANCNVPVGLSCQSYINLPYGLSTAILYVTDALAIAQTLMSLFENGFSEDEDSKSACERVPEIEKELKEILQYT